MEVTQQESTEEEVVTIPEENGNTPTTEGSASGEIGTGASAKTKEQAGKDDYSHTIKSGIMAERSSIKHFRSWSGTRVRIPARVDFFYFRDGKLWLML